jgi:hypothetical protein
MAGRGRESGYVAGWGLADGIDAAFGRDGDGRSVSTFRRDGDPSA